MPPQYKDDSFTSRLNRAANARKAVLNRVSAQPGPGDPTFEERQAARLEAAKARDARRAERKAEREAEALRIATERAEREAAEAARMTAERTARAAEEERLAAETKARALELAAAQKAARDARYAARKARKR
jgi:hypothetical protein